jgi:1,4-alpha-glucan branching enzyme
VQPAKEIGAVSKKSHVKIKKQRVTFTFASTDAKEVFLVGDFNNWNQTKHPMKKDENGIWKNDVMVSTGTYEYKYLMDDKWKTDKSNKTVIRNRFGTLNNVLLEGT